MTTLQKAGAYGPYDARTWRIIGMSFAGYVLVHVVLKYLAPSIEAYPEYAIAIATVYFGGFRLLPALYITGLFADLAVGAPLNLLLVEPIAMLLQSALGGYLLRHWNVDPMFRRDRDIFRLLIALLAASAIVPSIELFAGIAISGGHPLASWMHTFVGSLSSLMILTPFILRWFSKRRFARTGPEILEILSILTLLSAVSLLFFVFAIRAIFMVPLVYVLLLSLYALALRHRPRFVTLGLLIVTTCAFAAWHIHHSPTETIYNEQLFLIAIAINFLIIASLEEHRRVNANRLRTQVVTLENVVARLSTESQAKNDFIAVLAHELRNPLTPVQSGIDILKLQETATSERSVLESMAAGMQTVRSLLNDLLDVSRISEGKISLRKVRIDIMHALEKAVAATDLIRKERHQTLDFKKPKEKLFIHADELRMEQIFSNLLTNASKYSYSGGIIKVDVQKNVSTVEIRFIDHGVGIDKKDLETIFQPFKQVGTHEQTKEGLGIGLSLVHDFVKLHDGNVEARSGGLGKGSVFTVTLPLATDEHTINEKDA